MKDITISRRSLLVSAGLLALAPLAGCGGNSGSGSAAAGSDYTIGVLQLTEHSALDAANAGFVKAIKKSGLKVKIDQKNAQNDQSTCKSIADKFVGDNVNLIYAIATPAAQAAAGAAVPTISRGRVTFVDAALPQGVVVPDANLAVFSIADLNARMDANRARSRRKVDITQITFPFKPGDYVVHATHGIALFSEIARQEVGGKERTTFCWNMPTATSSTCRWSRLTALRATLVPTAINRA